MNKLQSKEDFINSLKQLIKLTREFSNQKTIEVVREVPWKLLMPRHTLVHMVIGHF